MKLRPFLLVSLFALGACATAQRALSYPAGHPDADVFVGNQRFQVWFHERDQTVFVQRGDPQPFGQLLAQNATIYVRDATLGPLWWGAAANAVLVDFGCYGTELTGQGQVREVKYTCPQPVNVNAQVPARRGEWRRGVRVEAPAAG